MRSMAPVHKGDVILFQRNGQEFEHKGLVAKVKTAYCMVIPLPVDPHDEKIMLMFCTDYWKIVERDGKPYFPPDQAGPVCSAVPILDNAVDVDDPDVPHRKRFFGGPTKKGSRRKRAQR